MICGPQALQVVALLQQKTTICPVQLSSEDDVIVAVDSACARPSALPWPTPAVLRDCLSVGLSCAETAAPSAARTNDLA
jgi:hypothetical protein